MGTHEHDSAVVKFDNPKDVLIAARKLIEKPNNWCQGSLSQSRLFGLRTAYCMVGAVNAVSPDKVWPALEALRAQTDGTLASFNDSHTHAEVLAAFDRAIEQAGAA